MYRNKKYLRFVAAFIGLNLIADICFPTVAYALTSGPTSPDFASFEPVATTDMVNLFSGDFNYNVPVISVPGAEGGGYAMSLSYHAGVNQETEASWVGLGWTLNPGVINRGVRGFPDDYKNASVIQYNKTRPNWTAAGGKQYKLEISSKESESGASSNANAGALEKMSGKFKAMGQSGPGLGEDADITNIGVSLSSNIRFNSHTGFVRTSSFGVNASGFNGFSGGLNVTKSGSEVTAGMKLSYTPQKVTKFLNKLALRNKDKKGSDGKVKKRKVNLALTHKSKGSITLGTGGAYSVTAYKNSGFNLGESKYFARSVKRNRSWQVNSLPMNLGFENGTEGSFNIKVSAPSTNMLANGYMYNPDRSDMEYEDGDKNLEATAKEFADKTRHSKVLSDYFKEKDQPFKKASSFIGIPFNNADGYSVMGEGLSGGFRLHHKSVGHYYPNFSENKSKIGQMGIEFGIGTTLTIGLNFGFGNTVTTVSDWKREGHTSDFQFNKEDKPIFRFTGDLAGQVNYSDNTDAESFELEGMSFPGLSYWKPISGVYSRTYDTGAMIDTDDDGIADSPEILTELISPSQVKDFPANEVTAKDYVSVKNIENASDIGRSSYITYLTNKEITDKLNNGQQRDIAERSKDLVALLKNSRNRWKDRVGELAFVRPGGTKYTFGLPVYTRQNVNASFMANTDVPFDESKGDVENVLKHEAGVNLNSLTANKVVIGENKVDAYATNYLITQVTGVNYVDLKNDGPDESDLGSWVKFRYRKQYGYDTAEEEDSHDHEEEQGGGSPQGPEGPGGDDDTFPPNGGDLPTNTGEDKWFKYRMPYTGFNYVKGSIADDRDDMLSVSTGERENYTLSTVETNTHIAFFVTNETKAEELLKEIPGITDEELKSKLTKELTGSQTLRMDALGAADDAGENHLAKNMNMRMEYLEKVVLFAKSRMERPIQTVRFEYDYSLVPNTPNSQAPNGGKLTLKRMWTEHEGVQNARIAPTEFKYNYKKSHEFVNESLKDKYKDIVEYGDRYDGYENEEFDNGMGPWGFYQKNGEKRKRKLAEHLEQVVEEEYDPAVWNLKQIILPSGGEIHIQYEEKDYRFVQDQRAMGLVSLKNTSKTVNAYKYDSGNVAKYYPNLEDMGIFETDPDYAMKVQELKSLIESYYNLGEFDPENVKQEEDAYKNISDRYMFFKFLFAYDNDQRLSQSDRDLNSHNNEYIDGFGYVRAVGVDNDGDLYVEFGPENRKEDNSFKGVLKRFRKDKSRTMPRRIAFEKYVYGWGGMDKDNSRGDRQNYLDFDKSIFNYVSQFNTDQIPANVTDRSAGTFRKDYVKPVMKATGMAWDNVVGNKSPKYKTPKKKEIGKYINYSLSYLKLPLLNEKRGGGVRVKRLLMYDKGLEGRDEALYGTEYIYEDVNGRSSGVATTEPSSTSNESPLVRVIKNRPSGFLKELVAGKMNADQIGPIGESLLPAPTVGHSRVVVRNIHGGVTGSGYMVHEYNTCKDYPFDMTYSSGDHMDINGKAIDYTKYSNVKRKVRKKYSRFDWMSLPLPFLSYKNVKAWVAQGFRFAMNEMHGTPKMVSSYPGDYYPGRRVQPTSYTKHLYYEPGEKVPLVSYDENDPNNPIKIDREYVPGKEMDMVMASRRMKDRTMDLGLEIDISYTPPTKFGFSGFPSFMFNETQLSTHATTKVIRYPVISRGQEVYSEGMMNHSEVLAFDKKTGQPLISRSYDAYDVVDANSSGPQWGHIYSMSIPGHWYYPELGQKSDNSNYQNQMGVTVGSLVTYGGDNANPIDWVKERVLVEEQSGADYRDYVVKASAVTLKNNWFDLNNDHVSAILDEYEGSKNVVDQLNKRYLPYQNYVYRSGLTSQANGGPERNYNKGYLEGFKSFDWSVASDQYEVTNKAKGWVKMSETTKYSPNGMAVEEVNAINIPAAVRMGYGKHLPVAIASNSYYEDFMFEDFENHEWGEENKGHTGNKGMPLHLYPEYNFVGGEGVPSLNLKGKLQEGAVVRLWLNSEAMNSSGQASSPRVEVNEAITVPLNRVARAGEWQLYEAIITNWGSIEPGSDLKMELIYNTIGDETVYLDDVKVQPLRSAVICYVYDPATFRLLAEMGDQHFAVMYKYGLDGRLAQKYIETEQGIKVLQDGGGNAPTKNRADVE